MLLKTDTFFNYKMFKIKRKQLLQKDIKTIWNFISNPYNLEKITRIFFNHRRKMIKKPFNQIFNGNKKILEKLNINLNLRPQNLDFETYYNLAKEYEEL